MAFGEPNNQVIQPLNEKSVRKSTEFAAQLHCRVLKVYKVVKN